MSGPADQDPATGKAPTTPERPPGSDEPPRFRRIGLALVLAIIGAAVVVVVLHLRQGERLRQDAARRGQVVDKGLRVSVTPVRAGAAAREINLPAEVRAFYQATVYAKVAGYVKSMRVDKGDAVRSGQILAILESPELDQQVAAAESDALIKRRTYERYGRLVSQDYVSRQDYETVRAQYGVSLATLRQTRALQKYRILRAPFDGTVTARYVDAGALVPAATGGTASALPVVDVSDARKLRVSLFVQQDAAPFVRVGDPAIVVQDQRPDAPIHATVSRVSEALDVRSRSMLCEIWLDNRNGLYPGTFVHVTLHLHAPAPATVPSTALLLRNDQMIVPVVRASRVKFVPVKTGADDGRSVQILSGVRPGDLVAINLPTEVSDGDRVQPYPAKAQPGPGPTGTGDGTPAGAAAPGGPQPPPRPPSATEQPGAGAPQGRRPPRTQEE
jgi:RND family efflux transporter MFP subunit